MTAAAVSIGMRVADQLSTTDAEVMDTVAFAHGCLLMDALAEVARAAARDRLRFILLKGAAMIVGEYNRTFVRPMTDVDLLVPEAEYPQWKRLLHEKGFGPLPYGKSSFVKQVTAPLIFDLHTSLRFLTPGLLAEAWKGSARATYATVEYELLPLEIDLLYRCLHMTVTHGYGDEKWMRDMDALIRAPMTAIDWERLVRYTCACRASAPMRATLAYLRNHFNTPVPEKVVAEFDMHCSPMVARLFAHTLRRGGGIPFFDYIAPLLLQPSLLSMSAAAWVKLFPSPADMRQRYGCASKTGAVALYPVRVLQLAGKGVWALLHSLLLLMMHRAR